MSAAVISPRRNAKFSDSRVTPSVGSCLAASTMRNSLMMLGAA